MSISRDLVLINTSNYTGSNGVYKYNFPHQIHFKKGDKISLHSVSMYNSTYNISSALGNNTFSINWLGTTYNFVIQDGYYSIPQLNSFFQQQCILNDLYMTANNDTQDVYFFEVLTNDTAYKAEINIYSIPDATTASNLGYAIPTGATWTLPATPTTPQFILSAGLGKILGFSNQLSFPQTIDSNNHSYLSNIYPVLSPVFAYLLTCNLLNSSLNTMPTIFYQVPLNVSFGSLIQIQNPHGDYLDISPGLYTNITIQLYDQDYNTLRLQDPELTLYLLIERNE